MTKTFLLAATALTALIATSAQAQIAIDISNVDGTQFNAIEIDDYTLASELDWSAGVDADIEFAIVPSTSAVLPSGNAKLDITLTGAVFGEQVTAASILKTPAGCDPTRSVISGGGAAQSTVSFLLSDLTGCDNGDPIEVDLPVELDGTDVDLEINFRTEAGTGIDGQFDEIEGVVSFANAFTVLVETDTVGEAVADVEADPVYSVLTAGSNTVLGNVNVSVDTDVFVELYDTIVDGVEADFTDIDGLTVTVTPTDGSFAGLDVFIDGVDSLNDDDEATDDFSVAIASEGPNGEDFAITIDETASLTDVIEGGDFEVVAELDLDVAFDDEEDEGEIQSVLLGGTNFVAPWLAMNSTTSNSTLRIANGDDEDTGPLILTLTAWTDGVTPTQTVCDSADLAKLDGIGANTFVSINSADLSTCFGEDVTNGDVQVTIQGGEEDITAKARLTRAGVTTEVSLGRLGETDEAF